MDRRAFSSGTLLSLTGAGLARCSDPALSRLAEPRTHALMRHALAPGTGDPSDFKLRDCATQRNLSGQGRAQAVNAGEMLRQAGITIDHLWSSQWCRCLDTASQMKMGPVIEQPALNSFFRNRGNEPVQSAEIRRQLAALPAEETAFGVTHQVNITALTGRGVSSGEIFVLRVSESGDLTTLARVQVPLG